MNNISDCDGDVTLDQSNHLDGSLNSDNIELKDKEINVENTHDNSEADYGNSPINADIHESADSNQVNLDNDILVESEDIKFDETVNESSPVEQNNDEINDVPIADVQIIESNNAPISSSKPEKSSVTTKPDNQPVKVSKCEVCATTVYPMEKVILDAKIYHQNCFRCCKCKKALSPTVVSKSNGNLFCKPHYIELFRMRGKYDDIDVNNCQVDPISKLDNFNSSESSTNHDQVGDSSRGSISYTPLAKKEEKAVSAKDLAKRFQEGNEATPDSNPQRKQPIDIGVKNRITGWAEGQMEKESDFKRRNSNNNYANELDNVNQSSKGSVKNLKARFEIQN